MNLIKSLQLCVWAFLCVLNPLIAMQRLVTAKSVVGLYWRSLTLSVPTVLMNIVKWLLYVLFYSLINLSPTNDAFWRQILAACYQLAFENRFCTKVGGSTILPDSAWW